MTDSGAWALAVRNRCVARSVARSYASKSAIPFDDLFQQAMVGLFRAAIKFDPTKGTYRTYGRRWALRMAQLYAWEHGAAVHRSWAMRERLGNGALSDRRKPEDGEQPTISLDAPTMDGDGRISDLFGHDPTGDVNDDLTVSIGLSRAGQVERSVLSARLAGLGWDDVARSTGVTRAAAQRAAQRAVHQMAPWSRPGRDAESVTDAVRLGVTTERAIRIEFEVTPEVARKLLANAVGEGLIRKGDGGHYFVMEV